MKSKLAYYKRYHLENKEDFKIKNLCKSLASFFEDLKSRSKWFGELLPTVQKEMQIILAKAIQEEETDKKIVQLLPLLWRRGLNPEGGFCRKDLLFLAINEGWKFLSKQDRQAIVLMNDKLRELTKNELAVDILEETEGILNPGVWILSYTAGKLKETSNQILKEEVLKLKEKLEELLPEALVQRLFAKHLENEDWEW